MFRFRQSNLKLQRRRMVLRQIVRRGVTDKRVVAAMAWVPREMFVPPEHQDRAYADSPLPIGDGQTISQPYIVALMTAHARVHRNSKVLEIGTGSGYQTAILAKIVKHVWSIERVARFVPIVGRRLDALRIDNVTLLVGDGAVGYAAAAPYDAIIVAAAAREPPQPLLDQLAVGGHMIIPLGDEGNQMLTDIERAEREFHMKPLSECRFVPFVIGNGAPH